MPLPPFPTQPPDPAKLLAQAQAKLSPHLRPILDLELARGNAVTAVDEDAWSQCSLAVTLANPLDRQAIETRLKLPPCITWWENHDTHYSIEGGYTCSETTHSMAGQLK